MRYLKKDAYFFRQHTREHPYQISTPQLLQFSNVKSEREVGVFCVLVKNDQKMENLKFFPFFNQDMTYGFIFQYIVPVGVCIPNLKVFGCLCAEILSFQSSIQPILRSENGEFCHMFIAISRKSQRVTYQLELRFKISVKFWSKSDEIR